MPTEDNRTSFHAQIWGWSLDQGPPEVPGDNQFAPSPTPTVHLDSASTHVVPPQTLDLSTGVITPTANLNLIDAKWNGGQSAWHIGSSVLEVKGITPVPLTITFEAKAVSHSAHLTVTTWPWSMKEGRAAWAESIKIHTNTFRTYTVVVPATAWAAGFPFVALREDHDGGSKIVVRSITASTEKVDVQIGYYWTQIKPGYLDPGASYDREVSITTGTTTSVSTTDTFGVTIGAEVGGDYKALEAKLSATFSYEHSSTHTISVSKETSTTETVTVAASKHPRTFQAWQLCMVFTDSFGQNLTQNLPSSMAPIEVRTFEAKHDATKPTMATTE